MDARCFEEFVTRSLRADKVLKSQDTQSGMPSVFEFLSVNPDVAISRDDTPLLRRRGTGHALLSPWAAPPGDVSQLPNVMRMCKMAAFRSGWEATREISGCSGMDQTGRRTGLQMDT